MWVIALDPAMKLEILLISVPVLITSCSLFMSRFWLGLLLDVNEEQTVETE